MLRRRWISIALVLPLAALACGAEPEAAAARRPSATPASLRVITLPGRPGETCAILLGAKNVPLMRRCTYRYVSG
jgi:hypothetical protein